MKSKMIQTARENWTFMDKQCCESLKALLKMDIDWKHMKIPELIETLSDDGKCQFLDKKAAL